MLGVAITAFAAPAFAADAVAPVRPQGAPIYQAPTPVYDWSGFYLGVNGGYAFGRSSWSDPFAGGDSGRFNTKGGLIGGQIGYNWQVGRTVLGLESDINWARVSGSAANGGVCAINGGGATRARIGYAFGNFLPYVTGGLAYGDVNAVQANGSQRDTRAGWTAGGGLEVGLTKSWTAKAEYLHLDLGTATFMGAASGTNSLKVPITDDILRAGLNYRW